MKNVQPVILSGGSGSRLWPLSRTGVPKQFLCLAGEETLLHQSLDRLMNLTSAEINVIDPYIVANNRHRFLVSEILREAEIRPRAIILEPLSRNTAPALTLAALAAIENDDPILIVSPSDHAVGNISMFSRAMLQAIQSAADGAISILGVTPNSPETGFGYIQAGDPRASNREVRAVKGFMEKPDVNKAKEFIDSGDFFWNSGIFILRSSTWIKAIKKFAPDIFLSTERAWVGRKTDGIFVRLGEADFSEIRGESIDRAVLEKCIGSEVEVHMIHLDAEWSDLGTWRSIWNSCGIDEGGNIFSGDVIALDATNSLVRASSRLVAALGINDLVVVDTPDALLVADMSRSQDIGRITERLIANRRVESELHRRVNRPWGWYDDILRGTGFKIKQIRVNPGARLSLQRHRYRSEHWVVVSGRAEVTVGSREFSLDSEQHVFIAQGEVHRLSNFGLAPLEIIEIQLGDYLEEDDIIRLDDDYGRVQG